jgi:hypothetical protein
MQPVHDDFDRILADFTSNETALQDVIRDLSEEQLDLNRLKFRQAVQL